MLFQGVDGEDILGKIDADEDNEHRLTSRRWRMETTASQRGTSMRYAAIQRAPWDGEIRFIL